MTNRIWTRRIIVFIVTGIILSFVITGGLHLDISIFTTFIYWKNLLLTNGSYWLLTALLVPTHEPSEKPRYDKIEIKDENELLTKINIYNNETYELEKHKLKYNLIVVKNISNFLLQRTLIKLSWFYTSEDKKIKNSAISHRLMKDEARSEFDNKRDMKILSAFGWGLFMSIIGTQVFIDYTNFNNWIILGLTIMQICMAYTDAPEWVRTKYQKRIDRHTRKVRIFNEINKIEIKKEDI